MTHVVVGTLIVPCVCMPVPSNPVYKAGSHFEYFTCCYVRQALHKSCSFMCKVCVKFEYLQKSPIQPCFSQVVLTYRINMTMALESRPTVRIHPIVMLKNEIYR